MNYLLIPAWVFSNLMYAGALLALAAGVVLTIGLFTARRGWEPRCRKCAHDLRSIDPAKRGCPECGADLTKRRAVLTGRRSVRPVVTSVGCVLLALAALTSWKLDAQGVMALRVALVGSMPTQTLIDMMFEQTDATGIVGSALRKRVRATPAPRQIPTGALLAAVLHAADRCEEAGRRPLSAVLQSEATFLVDALDADERSRLIDLAIEELLQSDGEKSSRYQLAVAIDRQRESSGAAYALLIERLNTTPAGRRVLALKPSAAGVLSSGEVERIALWRRLTPPSNRGFNDYGDQAYGLVLAEAMLEALDGSGQRVMLASIPRTHTGMPRENGAGCDLLIDAPPGKYRLHLTGAVAESVLLPRAKHSFDTPAVLTVEEALKLDGAVPYAESCEVEVGPPAIVARVFTDAPELAARVAQLMGTCRLALDDGEVSIVLDSLLSSSYQGRSDDADGFPSMMATVSARQGSRAWPVGQFSTASGGYSAGMHALSSELRTNEPFDLVIEPQTALNCGRGGPRWDPTPQGAWGRAIPAFVWCNFTLHFENAVTLPKVETQRLPLLPSVGTARVDDATRRVIEGWAATLDGDIDRGSQMARRGQPPPIARSIGLAGAAKWNNSPNNAESFELLFDWPKDLCLSGWFELRTTDRLAAPSRPVFGPMGHGGTVTPMMPVFAVSDDDMLIVRYTPDARVGAADGSGPFAYVGAPFEVRFASKGAKPELVWLDGVSVPAASGAVKEVTTP